MLIFPMKQMGLNPNQFLAASVLPLCFSPSAHASFDKSSSSTLPSLDTSNFTTSRCLFLFPMTTGDKLPSDKQKLKNRLCFPLEVPSCFPSEVTTPCRYCLLPWSLPGHTANVLSFVVFDQTSPPLNISLPQLLACT